MAQISEKRKDLAARAVHLAEAEKCFGEAARLDPEDATTRNGLGNVLYMQGKLDEAIDFFRQRIRGLKLQIG